MVGEIVMCQTKYSLKNKHDGSYQTSTYDNQFNHLDNSTKHDDVLIINYDFETNLDNLSKYYTLYNEEEIYKFLKSHPNLVEALYQILDPISKYFKHDKLILEFVPDYEFEELNQVVVYICADENSFDKNWDLLNKLEDEIRNLDIDFSVFNSFFVDLW